MNIKKCVKTTLKNLENCELILSNQFEFSKRSDAEYDLEITNIAVSSRPDIQGNKSYTSISFCYDEDGNIVVVKIGGEAVRYQGEVHMYVRNIKNLVNIDNRVEVMEYKQFKELLEKWGDEFYTNYELANSNQII